MPLTKSQTAIFETVFKLQRVQMLGIVFTVSMLLRENRLFNTKQMEGLSCLAFQPKRPTMIGNHFMHFSSLS